MSEQNGLTYKGHPLMRKDNMVYYGSMADKYIVIMQILESKDFQDMSLADNVNKDIEKVEKND